MKKYILCFLPLFSCSLASKVPNSSCDLPPPVHEGYSREACWNPTGEQADACCWYNGVEGDIRCSVMLCSTECEELGPVWHIMAESACVCPSGKVENFRADVTRTELCQ